MTNSHGMCLPREIESKILLYTRHPVAELMKKEFKKHNPMFLMNRLRTVSTLPCVCNIYTRYDYQYIRRNIKMERMKNVFESLCETDYTSSSKIVWVQYHMEMMKQECMISIQELAEEDREHRYQVWKDLRHDY